MFTIVDLRTLRLEATVPVEEIGRLKVGTPVEFGVSGFDRRFTGKIERINPGGRSGYPPGPDLREHSQL